MTDRKPDTIEDCLERMRAAANAADAQAFAAEFDENATYVTFFGQALLGRREIERFHEDAFAKFPAGTQMAIKAISVRPFDDNFASVLTVGGLGEGTDIPYDKLQTFAMVCREGRWVCAAFHNTEMNATSKQEYNVTESPGRIRGLAHNRLALGSNSHTHRDVRTSIVRCVPRA